MAESNSHRYSESGTCGRALDEILTDWTSDETLEDPAWMTRYPELGDEGVTEVLEIAREIAVLRPHRRPRIPGFRIFEELGRGGMGIVYRAEQVGLERIVALKVCLDETRCGKRSRARFHAEVKSLGQLRHPNVVTIYGIVETNEVVAYAMEWVDGRSLASLLEELGETPRSGGLPPLNFGGPGSERLPRNAVHWFCTLGVTLARALAVVHEHGLVHRDVKPSNVLLSADGTALLSDFGLVRDADLSLTRTGQVLGTPAFAAPEQLRGAEVGPAADIFALGATLHCALAGRAPFVGSTPMELLASIEGRRRSALTQLGISKDLDTIIGRCVEADPADRYASMSEVADDLDNLLALRPVNARPLGFATRSMRRLRRNRGVLAAVIVSAALTLVVAVGLGYLLWQATTLAERFEQALAAARFLILEPTHEERIELARADKGPERPSVFMASSAAALAAYDAAVDLDSSRTDAALERDIVRVAHELIDRGDAVPSATMLELAPATTGSIRSWTSSHELGDTQIGSMTTTDRRALGLLAFLLGRVQLCHAAWSDLELTGDPFIDAASGQLHMQNRRWSLALPRLSRASHAWPNAGFLATAMADCSVRVGDLGVARRELERAKKIQLKDPFDTHVRVEADLLAALGRYEEAVAAYEHVIAKHKGVSARRNYATMLERTGDMRRWFDLQLDAAAKGHWKVDMLAAARRYWSSLSWGERRDEFLERWSADCGNSRLLRLELWWLESEKRPFSSTQDERSSSANQEEAIGGLGTLMEVCRMEQGGTMFGALPRKVQSVLASIHAVAGSAQCGKGSLGRWFCRCLIAGVHCISVFVATSFGSAIDAQGSPTAQWTNVTTSSGPSPRRDLAMAIDPTNGNALVHGGYHDATRAYSNETWSWDGAVWTKITATPNPGSLAGASMVGLPTHQIVVLFGGYDSATASYVDRTWIWNGTSWTNVTMPTGNPPGRAAHQLVYDESRDVVVLHGGFNGTAAVRDTWEWQPATRTWRQVSSVGPTRYFFGFAYDPVRRRSVLHGGSDGPGRILGDTWAWDGATWTQVVATGPARWTHAMTWDDARQAVVIFGGADSASTLQSSVTVLGSNAWTWSLAKATSLSTPLPRSYCSMVYHPKSDAIMTFGGWLGSARNVSTTWIMTSQLPARIINTGPGCPDNNTMLVPEQRRRLGSGPWLGGTLVLDFDKLPSTFPNVSLLLLGASNPNLDVGRGCAFRSDLLLPPLVLVGARATWSLPISPSWGPLTFYSQVVSLSLVPGPFPTAMSNGFAITLGSQ